MKSLDELKDECRRILVEIRKRSKSSKERMAEAAGVSFKTWTKAEQGETELTLSQFVSVFLNLGEPVLRNLQEIIYPDIYKELGKDSQTDAIRKAGTTWVNTIATDQQVRLWNYILTGPHGSNANAQLTEFAMIDQLPMRYRLIVAQNILMLWRLAQAEGELVGTNDITVDVQAFADGIAKGRDAVLSGKNSYTTIAR